MKSREKETQVTIPESRIWYHLTKHCKILDGSIERKSRAQKSQSTVNSGLRNTSRSRHKKASKRSTKSNRSIQQQHICTCLPSEDRVNMPWLHNPMMRVQQPAWVSQMWSWNHGHLNRVGRLLAYSKVRSLHLWLEKPKNQRKYQEPRKKI